MQPMLIVIMAFFLTAIALVGGFVLLMPLSRQLARYLDYRMQEKGSVGGHNIDAELRQLSAMLEGIDDKVRSVSERQEFLEKVLTAREQDTPTLPR